MSDPFAIERLRWVRAELVEALLDRSIEKLSLALKLWNPDQPRAPAGNSDGGQWIGVPGSRNSGHVRVAQAERTDKYRVDLQQEDAYGGHGYREHVGKTDDEMLSRVAVDRGSFGIFSYARMRDGSFASIENANNFVNRTLEQNQAVIDAVAAGKRSDAFVISRFGYVTGREAFRENIDASPYMRNTYEVGVYIVADPRIEKGFRVQTAYPINQSAKN